MPAPKRPRLDAVLRHIESGSYDDVIEELLAAISARQDNRRERVRKMVKEVYGEDYDVARDRSPLDTQRPNPFLPSLGQVDPEQREWADPEIWTEAEERAKAEEEALKTEATRIEPAEDDVSNSPIIGSIDVSPGQSPHSTEDQQ